MKLIIIWLYTFNLITAHNPQFAGESQDIGNSPKGDIRRKLKEALSGAKENVGYLLDYHDKMKPSRLVKSWLFLNLTRNCRICPT